jgi:hypothetical protein
MALSQPYRARNGVDEICMNGIDFT